MATDITNNCNFGSYQFYTYPVYGSHLLIFIIPVNTALRPDTSYVVNFPSGIAQIFLTSICKFNELLTDGTPAKFTYKDDSIEIYRDSSTNNAFIKLSNGAVASINNRFLNTAVGVWFKDTEGNIITRDSTFFYGVNWVADSTGNIDLKVHAVSTDSKGYIISGASPNTYLFETPYYISSSKSNIDAYRKLLGNSSLYDTDDPDVNTNPSGGAGGGGSGHPGGDTNEDDGVPSLSAVDCGLLTMFNPNNSQLQSLGKFLWSDGFNLDSFKKLFNNPFDSIFGLSVIPIQPETQGAQNVYFGNIDTGVSMPVVKSQWVSIDMGTIDLSEIYNSALDYEPTTAVSIYLPYIGMRQLNTVDVMASSLHLIYKFDVLTGSVVAQLYVNHSARNNKAGDFSRWTKNQGFLYSYAGQCAVSIPLSSQSFTNIIQAAISSVGIAAGAAATMATGNPALGVAALSVGTANIGIQSSGSVVQRSGHLSGSQALLDYQTPMLIVIRPHRAKPSKYYNYRGVPSQTTTKLSECSGYTQIADGVSVSASGATDAELNEITSLLRSGVIF